MLCILVFVLSVGKWVCRNSMFEKQKTESGKNQKMVHIAICDDDSNMVKYLCNLVQSFLKTHKIIGKVVAYTNAEALLFDTQGDTYYDLIFLDIEMEKLNGMEAAARIREYDAGCLIIFLTSHLEYAVDAFQLSVFRYIPKAQIAERLETDLASALKKIQEDNEKYYVSYSHKSLEKIYHKDILFIQKDGKNSVLYTQTKGIVKIRKSLSDLFSELSSDEFIFTDRGCIVNIIHIMKIENDLIYLRNGEKIYISKPNVKSVKLKTAMFWSDRL